MAFTTCFCMLLQLLCYCDLYYFKNTYQSILTKWFKISTCYLLQEELRSALEDGASRICRVAAEIFLTAPGWGGDKLLERAMAEEKDVPGSSVKGCLNVPGCDPLLSSAALDN